MFSTNFLMWTIKNEWKKRLEKKWEKTGEELKNRDRDLSTAKKIVSLAFMEYQPL